MRILFVLALAVAAVAAHPRKSRDGQRIIGGEVADIQQYPSMANLMFSWTSSGHVQACGGTVINNRSILTAAHCFIYMGVVDFPYMWRVRLGSSYRSSGGTIYDVAQIINHPDYDRPIQFDNDVGILRLSASIVYSTTVQPTQVAGSNYNLLDNSVLWSTGWGRTTVGGAMSEQLRHVQVYAINQQICRSRYAFAGYTITDEMMCSGVLDIGGRESCQGDSGGPLYHNNVVVGICSWAISCAHPYYPGVNARVSSFTNWIVDNA